jgi:hypothetical protein
MDGVVDAIKNLAAITPGEEASPVKIKYFPNPGKLPSLCAEPKKAFGLHLRDWFYKDLSSASHLSFVGFFRGAGQLSRPRSEWEHLLPKVKSDQVFRAVTLLLALLSELEIALSLEERSRLTYLWSIVSNYWGEAKEVYDMRYAAALVAP